MKKPHTKLLDSRGLLRDNAMSRPRSESPVTKLLLYMSREDAKVVVEAIEAVGVEQQSATAGTFNGRAVAAICRAWLADRRGT